MPLIQQLWRGITGSRQTRERALKEECEQRTRALESQILLLRAENRALLNSVLGIAGIPPIMVTDQPDLSYTSATSREANAHSAQDANGGSRIAGVPPANPLDASAGQTSRHDAGAAKTAHPRNGDRIVTPLRRRSWHQIYRMLELESVRRKSNEPQGTT